MSSLAGHNFFASNTIQPSRFVSLDTASGKLFHVLESSTNDTTMIGISQPGSFDPPGVIGAQTDAARGGNVGAPGAATLAAGTLAAGSGSLTAGTTYFIQYTWVTPFGESTPSTEQSQATAASGTGSTSISLTPNATIPAGVIGANVYIGATTGTEVKQNTSLVGVAANQTYQISSLGTGPAPPASDTSGYPASGTTLQVYGVGDVCLLRLASGVTAGDWLGPNGTTDGRGKTQTLSGTTALYYGAKALETASAGELARVVVLLGAITPT
jgi:hypothetical protein